MMIRPSFRNALAFLAAALLAPFPASALDAVSGPTLVMNPNGVTPLAGIIKVGTDVPTRVSLSISDGVEVWGVDFPDFSIDHTVPLLGLKSADAYTVDVYIFDQAHNHKLLSTRLTATTDALPAGLPKTLVIYSNPSLMEPGYTLLDRNRRGGTTGTLYSMILDNKGDVRWYSTVGGQDGMRQLPNGNLLLLNSSEMDLLGNIFTPRTLQVPGVLQHHDIFPTAYGSFFSLSLEELSVPNYPTSDTDPNAPAQTQTITSDIIVEYRPDGSVERQWHLTDIVDPHRIGYDSIAPGFPLFRSPDWSHSNAVVYDPKDDSIIVSIRHQDAVIKFSRATGQLIWILGPHDNWGPAFQQYLLKPVGTPFEWQFHQHAPQITPQGTLLLMDNGNRRASPFDGRVPLPDNENYSRAVEYSIDETKMEVHQVWEYGAAVDWRLFSASQGDANWMTHSGNVMLTLTDTRFIAGLSSALWGLGLSHTAIIEVTHNTPPQPVFDLRVYDPDPTTALWVYRSERIPSLYAANVHVAYDFDHDGVPDNLDNCIFVKNADQRDSDHDGFGNVCDPDLNNDGTVDYVDLFYLKSLFQSHDANADFDGDGVVSWSDLQTMLNMFLSSPGPSGIAPPQ